ncbi:penicillin acylase family protein [Pseudonocardia hydrocarbonoxydans]|uniref:Penicillin amidase n=1 Tax=Pseudonocardia hydrocarbonoxydans TaxID=76726 RepID=A0A4Y3WNY3_9PSEU|nr:penicillin acylase family protein [Pseudonocardia hydrocarbonoxydans]GEC20515.1 penicillin amidase [Pseudonocardia hydrocarbonoxydans]
MKILVRALVVLGVLVLVAALVVVWTVRQPFPQVDGEVALPGLSAEVTVRRDAAGVPHIYADTSADLFAAQGYVHAQDRFWEMDVRRHTTAGRLSELFGEATLTEDRVIRTMGWRRVAEQELPLLDPRTRAYLDAYATGVNAWLAQHDDARERALEYVVLGLTGVTTEPEPWTALDSLAWLKAMAWDLRTNLPDELARSAAADTLPPERVAQLYPEYPFDRHPTIVEGTGDGPGPGPAVVPAGLGELGDALDAVPATIGAEGGGIGSNSWVIAGEHTASGRPLLANDPHLGSSLPSVWHQVGLHCRVVGEACPFDVTGFSFSGLPGVVIGHNDRIAWGFTNLGPDVMDLSLERVDDTTYERLGARVPLDTRVERIEVAGGEPVELTVRSTDAGPIVSDVLADGVAGPDGSNAVALRWTALEPGRTADSLFALNTARDWPQFREALRTFDVPGQNVVYADVDGNIGYQATGRVPIRASGDGRAPAPGWTGAHAWTGSIPYDAMPYVLNPPEGYVVTANNAVVDPAAYGTALTYDWSRGYRAQRIRDLLDTEIARGPVDVATMGRVQFDSRVAFADDLVPAVARVDDSPAADLLRGWDGTHGADSAPAAYAEAVWRHLLLRTFDDELTGDARPGGGDRWFEVVRALLTTPEDPFWDDVTTPARETRDDMLRAAVADANAELTERLGADPQSWRWGDLHRLELTHATLGTSGVAPIEWLFNRGPYPVGGTRDAVDATSWNAQVGYEVTAVPSMRMIVDLADPGASRWVDHTGVSGHAFHEHYADQTGTWSRGETLPMHDPTARHTLVLRR